MSHSCEMLGGLCAPSQLKSQQLRGEGPPLSRLLHFILLFIQRSPPRNVQPPLFYFLSHYLSLIYLSTRLKIMLPTPDDDGGNQAKQPRREGNLHDACM